MISLEEESAIIDEIISGNKELYRKLVDSHKSYAFSLAYRIMKDHDEAEDVAQMAFIKAFRSLKYFNRTSRFSSWLFRIVYNTALSSLRKKKDTESFEINKYESSGTYTEEPLEAEDRRKIIEKALNKLPEIDRSIVHLFYLQEYSLEEVGEIISMNPNNVKVKLHRARKKLAVIMESILSKESLSLY